MKFSRSDFLALVLSLLGVLASSLVAERVFERMAHLEDELAYVWQAQAIAGGHLVLPSPPEPKSFLVPFVVDYKGQRFGKYPLGWPVVLAAGEFLGGRWLVNPLLAGLGIWLTYRLGRRVFSETVGLLAAGLTLTSPFFLMNSGSLLSHPLGLVLSAAFALAWLECFTSPHQLAKWRPVLVGGFCLGYLALTRPFTALAIGLPFGFHGVILFLRGDRKTRLHLAVLGAIALGLSSLLFAWQYSATGDPFLNPYTLWWEYDKIGFGLGFGRLEEGHTLKQAWVNTRHSLWVGQHDLFGWGSFSWIFLPFGLVASLRNRRAWLLGSVIPSLVVLYLAYWVGSALYGPRYYYEGLFCLSIFSAAGIALLAGWPLQPQTPFPSFQSWHRLRPLALTAVLALLVAGNLLFYTPIRVGGMFGLYGVQRSHLRPFLLPSAQENTPALVIVHSSRGWIEYGRLLELQTPYLDTPFIFVISRYPEADQNVIRHFPERKVLHYFPDEPYNLYTTPPPAH